MVIRKRFRSAPLIVALLAPVAARDHPGQVPVRPVPLQVRQEARAHPERLEHLLVPVGPQAVPVRLQPPGAVARADHPAAQVTRPDPAVRPAHLVPLVRPVNLRDRPDRPVLLESLQAAPVPPAHPVPARHKEA